MVVAKGWLSSAMQLGHAFLIDAARCSHREVLLAFLVLDTRLCVLGILKIPVCVFEAVRQLVCSRSSAARTRSGRSSRHGPNSRHLIMAGRRT